MQTQLHLATALAHEVLAALLRDSFVATSDLTGCATSEQAGLLVRVTVEHYSPMKLTAEPRLTRQQKAILGVCSKDKPLHSKAIARKLGIEVRRGEVSSYLRKMLRRLVRLKLLERTLDREYILP